jgi:hypothetical protein
MIPVLGDIIHEVGETVRKVIPDADKRMDIEVQLAQLSDAAEARETALLAAQVGVNRQEAASGNIFIAGWRPFIGWTCGTALAYTWIVAPVAKTLFHLAELPIIQPDQIYPIVLAMLGIGGMRTYEKVRGVATGVLGSSVGDQKPIQESASAQEEIGKGKSILTRVGSWFT